MTPPKLALATTDAAQSQADAVIIATMEQGDGIALAPGAQEVDAAFGGTLTQVLASLGAKGRPDEVVKLPTLGKLPAGVLVATGLGKVNGQGPTGEQVRRASGAAARALSGVDRAVTTLSSIDLRAAVEGSSLGAYTFSGYKSRTADAPLAKLDVVAPADGDAKAHRAALKEAAAVAEAVVTTRDWVNMPPNDLYPASFAEMAAELARSAGVEVAVLDEKALRKGGFGGILGVGGGSARQPRLVKLTYRGPKARAKVALVGKGITFDTGGISIKPAARMEEMSSDMGGAAAVIATVVLAAKLKLPLQVTAYAPMAENMPSGAAYRPGDVLTMYGGRTVEVLNTDAEGRLILADAISLACEDEPDYLVETSTLTGAQVIALGKRTAGIMGSDAFRDRVAAIAAQTGEGGWPMPFPEHLRGDLDSKLADIANVTGHRWGGMLAAGIFMREFVPDGQQWVHIDVAGPSYNDGAPWGYTGKGGTGIPVRTLAALLADIVANG